MGVGLPLLPPPLLPLVDEALLSCLLAHLAILLHFCGQSRPRDAGCGPLDLQPSDARQAFAEPPTTAPWRPRHQSDRMTSPRYLSSAKRGRTPHTVTPPRHPAQHSTHRCTERRSTIAAQIDSRPDSRLAVGAWFLTIPYACICLTILSKVMPATRLHTRSAEAAALTEPGPSDFPASGRRERLKDLALRNETVYVQGKNDGTKVYATLCGDKIHIQANAILNRVPLEPAQFVAIAGHEVHSEQEACALIYLESGPNLADFVENGKDRKWNASAVAACLETQFSVSTMQNLPGLFQECADRSAKQGLGKYAYRVCRPEETPQDIQHNGLRISGAAYRSTHMESGPAVNYFKDMCEHVKKGSHHKRRPFISASRDLVSAMHWAYAGVSTIVKIDLEACQRQGILFWDIWRDSFLLYADMAQNFGEASKEVVLDDSVPASCCEVLEIKWEFPADIQRSEQSTATRKFFPPWHAGKGKEVDPQEEIGTQGVLEDGSTKPLKVKIGSNTFVMKRGVADGLPNPSHMASEFFSLALYRAMGATVPRAALCHVKAVVKNAEDSSFSLHTKFLLTEFLDGTTFTYGANAGNDNVWVKQLTSVQQKCAADIAMSNYDVAGPGFSNLLICKNQVYRVDVGGSLSYRPDGRAKPTEHWRGTSRSVIGTANCFSYKGMNQNVVSKIPAGRRNDVKADEAVHMLFGATAQDPYELAKQARDILLHFQSYMHIWLDQNKRNQDSRWVTDFHIVLKRLKVLAGAVPPPQPAPLSDNSRSENRKRTASQSCDQSRPTARRRVAASSSTVSDEAGPSDWGLKDIVVVNTRSAKRKDGYTDTFQRNFIDKGFKVIDVTSKAKDGWVMLSPFYAHGAIPIPGAGPGFTGQSVEGIWQGLKVFPDGKGVDEKKFSNATMRSLKRNPRGMKPVGHWWGPFRGVDTAKATHDGNATLLGYVQAREQIYVPAYTFVIESPKVHSKLVELAHLARDSQIVLLDYFVNDDVKNVTQPLSHAGLIRKYLIENEEALLNAEVHAT